MSPAEPFAERLAAAALTAEERAWVHARFASDGRLVRPLREAADQLGIEFFAAEALELRILNRALGDSG